MAQIAEGGREAAAHAPGPDLVLDALDPAQLGQGRLPGLRGTEPGARLPVDRLFEEGRQLLVELPVEPGSEHE
jgi:hypothetical protein